MSEEFTGQSGVGASSVRPMTTPAADDGAVQLSEEERLNEELVGVLLRVESDHRSVADPARRFGIKCSCDAPWPTGWTTASHRIHVAEAQAAALAARRPADDDGLRARAWDEAVQALAWAMDNGPEGGALRYVAEHNPYRHPAEPGAPGAEHEEERGDE